jgi:hypothetical protein
MGHVQSPQIEAKGDGYRYITLTYFRKLFGKWAGSDHVRCPIVLAPGKEPYFTQGDDTWSYCELDAKRPGDDETFVCGGKVTNGVCEYDHHHYLHCPHCGTVFGPYAKAFEAHTCAGLEAAK